MPLKLFYKTKDEIPEELRQFYVEAEDGFVLDADDSELKGKVNEFRSNNRELYKENEKLKQQMEKFKDVDPEKYQEALKAQEKLEEMNEKNLLDEGKFEEAIQQRTERMRQDYEGRLQAMQEKVEALNGERDNFKNRLTETVVDSTIQQAVSNVASPRKGAMQDILSRARQLWTVDEEGNPVPLEGGKVKYGTDGDGPMTPEEWAQLQLEQAPYLFESNEGGGGHGNEGVPNRSGESVRVHRGQNIEGVDLEAIATGKTQIDFTE